MTKDIFSREIREVKAGPRRPGFSVRFFQRGGKFRIDYFEEEKPKLPRHFDALRKIVFRGHGGGEKERWMGILMFLYGEGKIRNGEKLRVSRQLLLGGGVEEALEELQRIDKALARIYKEEEIKFSNEILEIENEESEEIGFEGQGREEFQGKSTEKWFYEKILLPEVLKQGGRATQIIPQLEFSSLFPENEKDKRRVDFFLSGERGRGMVIEIDDGTHRGREEKDKERDKLVRGNRMRTFRIKDEELRDVEWARKKFRKALKGFYEPCRSGSNDVSNKNAEGIALVAGTALKRDFWAFEGKILVGDNPENEVFVQEVEFPWRISNYEIALDEAVPIFKTDEATKEGLRELLEIVFGFQEFREGQLEAILRVLRGEDLIVLLPTGSGKSIIYQMLALILPGAGIVVEPLRALMEDQVDNLQRKGIDLAVNLSGEIGLTQKKRMYRDVERGAYSLIYMTPERLQIREVRELFLRARTRGVGVSFVAIDEAHCVSEWGHDFRVPYLNLARTARELLRFRRREPRVIALTGTASKNVLEDMVVDLEIPKERIVKPRTFDRPEIRFRVIKAPSIGKIGVLERILARKLKRDFPNLAPEEIRGIIFCVYKNEASEFGVEAVTEQLREIYGNEEVVKYYGSDEHATMKENMRRFKMNEAGKMVATKAFGMGIDKSDIRFTVHFGITNSIEAYYQEAGRAGRDRKTAVSYIILSNDFPEKNLDLLTKVPIMDMKKELKIKERTGADDIDRLLYLHQKQFDKEKALKTTAVLLSKMGTISEKADQEKRIVARSRFEFEEFQKALYRLKLLGVVKDYIIFDFANNEFLVLSKKFNPTSIVLKYGEYVERYKPNKRREEMNKIRERTYRNQRDFLLAQVGILLDFMNEVFEKNRREAILKMVELAEAGACTKNLDEQDKIIRQGILKYLGDEEVGNF